MSLWQRGKKDLPALGSLSPVLHRDDLLPIFRFPFCTNAIPLVLSGDLCDLQVGRKALLQLLGLVIVLEHQSVEVLLASDLELDVVGLLVLLDPRGGSVLPTADLDELLDVSDLLGHFGGI